MHIATFAHTTAAGGSKMVAAAEQLAAVEINGIIHGTVDDCICCNPDVSGCDSTTATRINEAHAILHRNQWCKHHDCRETLERINFAYDGDRCPQCNAPITHKRRCGGNCGAFDTES